MFDDSWAELRLGAVGRQLWGISRGAHLADAQPGPRKAALLWLHGSSQVAPLWRLAIWGILKCYLLLELHPHPSTTQTHTGQFFLLLDQFLVTQCVSLVIVCWCLVLFVVLLFWISWCGLLPLDVHRSGFIAGPDFLMKYPLAVHHWDLNQWGNMVSHEQKTISLQFLPLICFFLVVVRCTSSLGNTLSWPG